MTNEQYSELALSTAPGAEIIDITIAQKRLLLGGLGLCGEAGEVAEMIKKHVFHGHPLDAEKITKLIRELGDVQWYINYLAYYNGSTLGQVQEANIAKLEARYPEGHFSALRSMNRQAGDE